MLGIKDLSLEDIEALAKIIKENKLEKIEIKNEEVSLTITGKKCASHNAPMPPMFAPPQMAVPTAAPVAETPVQEEKKTEGNIVKAPIVGTFYSKPAPDKEPFVKVGDTVKKGDVIMIIESMKLMNEVQSEFDGKIKEILVKDGQAVEYNQAVMVIE